jgi:hypothetical protein
MTTQNPGSFSVGGGVGGNINNIQGNNIRAVQGNNNQSVLGDRNRVHQTTAAGAETLTQEEIIQLLTALLAEIEASALPEDAKSEAKEDLSAAITATNKEEPNKKRALDRLTTAAETLEKTSKGLEAGQKIWGVAKPILIKAATWLGAAAGSHLLGL